MNQKPSIGRIVHVKHKSAWEGIRPGMIVGVDEGAENSTTEVHAVRVNVFLDGTRDLDALQHMRTRAQGNTLALPLFPTDVVNDSAVLGADAWAFWPPRI